MRKLLCFVLTLAMVLSMVPSVFAFTAPADAVGLTTYIDGFPASFETVPGSAGKDAEDVGFNITTNSYVGFGRTQSRNLYASYNKDTEAIGVSYNAHKYFVFQFNFKPYNNTYFTWTGVGQDNYAAYPGESSYIQNQWNKVAIVMDYTDIDINYIKQNYVKIVKDSAIADFAKAGTSTADPTYVKEAYTQDIIKKIVPAGYVYINGKKISGPHYAPRLRSTFGMSYNHWVAGDNDDFRSSAIRTDNEPWANRFFLKGGGTADFDDVYMYYTKTDLTEADCIAMTALPELKGTGYTTSGRDIRTATAITPAQLKADNPSYYIKAYTDSTLETELSDSALILPGSANTIVARDSANDSVALYTVKSALDGVARTLWSSTGNTHLGAYNTSSLGAALGQASGNARPNASEESSGNYYGKPWSDKSAIYTSNSTYQANADGEKFYRNMDATHSAIGTDGKHNYNYYVVRYEIQDKGGNPLQDMYAAASATTAGEVRDVANHKLSSIDADTYFRPSADWHKVVIVTDYSKVDTSYEAAAILENSRKGEPIGTGIANFDKDKVFPVTKTYVDGVLAYTAQPTRLQDRFAMYNTYYNGETKVENEFTSRWRMWFGSELGINIWMDNCYMEYYNYPVDGAILSKAPQLSAEGFSVVNNGYANIRATEESLNIPTATISRKLGGSFTLAEIEACHPQYTFSAYDNKLFRNAIGKNTPLAEGNLIHVVDKITGTLKNYIVSVKSVAERGDVLVEVTDGEKYYVNGANVAAGIRNGQLKLEETKVAGTAGKDAKDLGFTFSSVNETNYSTIVNLTKPLFYASYLGDPLEKDWSSSISDYTITKNSPYRYYVVSFNAKPHKITGNGSGIQFANLGGGSNISTLTPQSMMQDRWNRIALVYDFTDVDVDYVEKNFTKLFEESKTGFSQYSEDIKKKLTPVIYLYVNGKLVATGMSARFRDGIGIGMPHYTGADSKTYAADGSEIRLRLTGERMVTFDDVYAYTTSEDINFEEYTALPEIKDAGANATAVDNRLVIRSGATLEDLVADGEIVVYEGESLASGATLAIRGYNDGVNLCKVSAFDADASGATATDVLAGNWIVVAEYDADGNMVDCAIDVAAEDGDVSVEYAPSNATNAVRAYLLDGTNTLKPLSTYIVVQ